MARQLTLKTHCLLCLKDTEKSFQSWHSGNSKQVYERIHGTGFAAVASICDDCLGYLRGGNWPTDVYAKLSAGRRETSEEERAVEVAA